MKFYEIDSVRISRTMVIDAKEILRTNVNFTVIKFKIIDTIFIRKI